MSLALYRKYRPATFGELKGQEHVAEPLQQALRNGRIHHAYLFSGPRGCGKTSSARILARSLNCEQGPTPDPCGECELCVALGPTGSGHIDVIEIDAASHGGVDDARDLRERAFFAPVSARYKVYIIDEAHMVTREGFNALLKLVEEPPPHLKFVFATTEPEKVIGTIRSRTHHYPFRLIPPGTLRDLLEEILQKEGVPYEPAAIPLVVRAGAGSARDSESILDQLLAGAGEDGITYTRAVSLLGYTDTTLLDEVVDAVAARDGGAVFAAVDRVMEGGQDPRRFAADLLERFRDLVILANVPDAGATGLLHVPPDELERMQAQASRLGLAELARAADLLNAGLTEMRGATSPRLLLELVCARILLPGAYDDEASLLTRLERVERRMAIGEGVPAAGTESGGGRASPALNPPPARGGDPTSIVQPASPRREGERVTVDNSSTREGAGPGDSPTGAVPPSGRTGDGTRSDRTGGTDARSSRTGGAATQPSQAGGAVAPQRPSRGGGAGTPAGGTRVSAEAEWPERAQPGQGGRRASRPGAEQEPSGQPPPADAGWPQQARPGQATRTKARAPQADEVDRPEQAQSGSSGPAQSAAGAPGGVDVAAIRRMWVDILEAVKQRSKVAWIVLMEGVDVASLDGNVLTLAFANEGKRRGFTSGGKDAVLREALREVLGVDWRIEAILDNGSGPGGGGPRPSPPSPPDSGGWNAAVRREPRNAPQPQGAPPPQSNDLPPPPAPVDEADEVDPEGDADAEQAAVTGMALIEQELGGRVIQEIDNV